MTILFSNSSPKISKSWNFGSKLKDFHFCTRLCNKANLRTQISNMTIVFSNSTPKICKSGIFGPKFKDFYFQPNVTIRQIWGRWFEIWQWRFQTSVRKYPNKAVFVLNVSFFLHESSHIEKIKGTDFENGNSVFFKCQQKIPNYEIIFENSVTFENFFLSETLSELNFI